MNSVSKFFNVTDASFQIKPFWETLSYREFLTAFSLALLLVAMFDFFDYVDYGWIGKHTVELTLLSGFSILFVNHRLYKLEHGRSNNYIGRWIADLMLIVFAYILGVTKLWIVERDAVLDDFVSTFFAALTLIVIIETFVAFIKRILALRGWRPI